MLRAVIRSKLWTNEYQPEASIIPSFGQIISDQSNSGQAASAMDELVEHAFKDELY
jgi:hypothetical protein